MIAVAGSGLDALDDGPRDPAMLRLRQSLQAGIAARIVVEAEPGDLRDGPVEIRPFLLVSQRQHRADLAGRMAPRGHVLGTYARLAIETADDVLARRLGEHPRIAAHERCRRDGRIEPRARVGIALIAT